MEVNGYHVWALPPESSKEFDEGIGFSRLVNPLGDGYRAVTLYGSNTGLRKFRLALQSLDGTGLVPSVVDINGSEVTREEYVWSLYIECQVTGRPFVYKSRRDGQNYLVDFVNQELSYTGMRVALYSTGVELTQVRIPGATVFDPALVPLIDPVSGLSEVTESGDVISGPTQNGLPTRRLNSVSTNGKFQWLNYGFGQPTWFDIFLVIKCRETTFGQTSGVFTDNSGGSTVPRVLVGQSGTTKFTNLSLTDFEYRLDGDLYEQSDMQAPMGRFGIIHLRFPEGLPAPNSAWQMGQDRNVSSTQAEIDVADALGSNGLLPLNQVRAITEHLAVKWKI